MYGSLPASVFDRVGVLRELLCVRYGYCSQALLCCDEIDFVVQLLCLQQLIYFFYFYLHYCVLFTIFILNKLHVSKYVKDRL